MSTFFHLPPDAQARRRMLAAHLEQTARKNAQTGQQRWQATHLKLPRTHGNQTQRPQTE